MRIFDITLPISSSLPIWPGDSPVILEQTALMDEGAHDNVSRLGCSVHTGTHVDAPHHFLNDHRTVENLSLDVLIGKAQVIQIPLQMNLITADILEKSAIPQ
jgi:arylformamidase